MTKIRKYNGEILNYKGNYNGEITIKKHTPVRRPMSANWLAVESGTGTVGLVVQDISKGLENPLDTTYTQPLNVWNEWGEWTPEMVKMIDNIKLPKNSDITFFSTPKPKSLLERLTNKIRRKDNGK